MSPANTPSLKSFLLSLAEVFDGPLEIERVARQELRNVADAAYPPGDCALPTPIIDVMHQPDAHPICKNIMRMSFDWRPPETSADPLYAAHSVFKSHVELLGPDGLVKSEKVRLGLYGMLPNSEYGLRTHPAEEIFVMLAGESYWKRGDAPYVCEGSDGRSHHPSMLPHATKTTDKAFMSVYVWIGDLSTAGYKYAGLPAQ